MKRKVIAIITLATIALMINMVTVMATSVTPTLYSDWNSGNAYFERDEAGYISCPYAYKIDWIEGQTMNGEYLIYVNGTGQVVPADKLDGIDETLIAKIEISNDNGKTFNWQIVGILTEKTVDGTTCDVKYVMCAVIVKAGTNAYIFAYTHATSDTGLYAPYNKDISHVTFIFCETLDPQEFVYCYETAYGKGTSAVDFIPKFSNWGWTNYVPGFGSYIFDLWAGAGLCDTSKGTLVGNVTVVYSSGKLDVTFNVDAPYVLMNEYGDVETHVYAGKDMYPTIMVKGVPKETVAPGQYTINYSALDGGAIYVILHAVVGIPCE